MKKIYICVLVFALAFTDLHSEEYLSAYAGVQTAPNSDVSVKDENGKTYDFNAEWEGRSLAFPIYYGFKYISWGEKNTGFAIDFAHAKVYVSDETLEKSGFNTLEFSDGLNFLTLNYLIRRPQDIQDLNWFYGVGAGINVPHVEVQTTDKGRRTFEYQYGGYALQAQIGLEKNLSEKFVVFAEYAINYADVDVDLEGGGDLQTTIITRALKIGVNYKI